MFAGSETSELLLAGAERTAQQREHQPGDDADDESADNASDGAQCPSDDGGNGRGEPSGKDIGDSEAATGLFPLLWRSWLGMITANTHVSSLWTCGTVPVLSPL
jgi:hypothetical protein